MMQLFAALALGALASAGDGAADLVVRDGRVWTADPEQPDAEWVAIMDGRVHSLGMGEPPAHLIDEDTVVLEARGRSVLPGLIDAHVHLAGAAEGFALLDVRGAASREALLELVARRAAATDAGDWIVGRGWSAESWPDPRAPRADELQAAAGERPVVLVRMDGHSLIASSRALELAGIDAEGPADPAGGKIGRLADGQPDGALYESAMGLVDAPSAADTVEGRRALMRQALAQANAWGLTQVGAIDSRATIEQELVPLDSAGELTLRVRATVRDAGPTLSAWSRALAWLDRPRTLSPNVELLGFKGFMDGSLGSHTAWMLADFDDAPGNVGFPLALAETGELKTLIDLAADRGLQPAVHAIGDRANRTILDWYEAIPVERRADLRPRVEHAQHLAPEDVGRFAELGVVASMQPYHKADDGRYAQTRIGPVRCATSYAFRDLVDSGATLAFGSDWPVVSADPLLGLAAAVEAGTLDGKTFVPEQSLTLDEALTAYTRGAAFALHSEGWSGALIPGYVGDLVLVDRDLFASEESLAEARVVATVVGGRVVFARD
ncbi:amidohydrolase [Engelhardtia mirabilis]|uniref:N-substituted formamide deformylase n=1 Tax=Engelhardtia mirabilis TaxID=2528011 RepID=A0A518BN77_9BACT|nr:N-substituted formamide deformylase precursor [Planctomycetes bacterium Pla133]QDV02718.1 N-substituted formamide deformylase precursor [Planctomycetes bacterium Pla86]